MQDTICVILITTSKPSWGSCYLVFVIAMKWLIFVSWSTCFISASPILENVHQSNLTSGGPSVRIVGGSQVDIKSYPYQLSMQSRGRHICGASILSTKFAITAAHCTDKLSASAISLRAGTSTRQQGGQVVQVKSVNQHPKYNAASVDYDVSVLEVSTKFIFGEKVKNIAIGGSAPKEGSNVKASGWGSTREISFRIPTELRAVEVPVVSKSRCQKAYSRQAVITDRMLCAGVLNRGGKDSCQGDSGGPLVSSGKLVGIVSWGFGCGRYKYPGVYTNLNDKEIRSFVKRISGI